MSYNNKHYRTSELGLTLIKRFEGLYLKAYRDVAGVWTIGWGSTTNVKRGMEISEHKAALLLMEELKDKEACVKKLVKVQLTQKHFDALVSFAYNVGCGALGRSSLLRKLNKGDFDGASAQFNRWIYANKRIYLGLKRRRIAERALFDAGTMDMHAESNAKTPEIVVTENKADYEEVVESNLTEAAKTATPIEQDKEIALDTAPAGLLAIVLAGITSVFSRQYDIASFTGGVIVTLMIVSAITYIYMTLRKGK